MKINPVRRLVSIVSAAVLVVLLARPAVSAPHSRYVDGELLVKFRGGARSEEAERARRVEKHEIKRHFDFIGWQHIKLPGGMTVEEGLEHYRNLPEVLAVEPNGIAQLNPPAPAAAANILLAAAPSANDPMLGQQWGLAKIAAPNAWAVTTGSTDVVVAILDTGINYNHEDLRDNMWRNPGEIPGNGIDDDGNGFVDDVYGIDVADDAFGNDSDPFDVETAHVGYHGSACAGVIGAVGNNGGGISGVNWRVRLMAIRCVQSQDFISFADEVQALEYVLMMKRRGVNLRVISMSWGGFSASEPTRDAHIAVGNAGIVQVSIAGNFATDSDVNPFYPGSYPASNMIAVAASDQVDRLASFSGYGRTNVDLAAPGVAIVTTSGASTNAYYGPLGLDGTSFACPHVAGGAALLAALNPAVTAADIKAALLGSVDVLPAFTNRMVSNGRLNLGRAVLHPRVVPNSPPVIVSTPQSQTRVEGSNATFAVIAFGAAPLSYQWQRQSTPIPDATNATLSFTSVTTNHAGDYSILVTNPLGVVTSAVAKLTVVTFPRLVNPLMPLQIGAVLGETVTFNVETTGTLPIGYRWRHLRSTGANLNLTNLVLNEHRCFLSLTVGSNSAGTYTLVLTNVAQPTSNIQRTNAVLTVLADSDLDGLSDVWEAAYPAAANATDDTDHDGLTNLQEYRAGTDPTDEKSLLKLDSPILTAEGSAVVLRFVAAANRTYAVQAHEALSAGPWTNVAEILATSSNCVEAIVDSVGRQSDARRFYRLVTPRP